MFGLFKKVTLPTAEFELIDLMQKLQKADRLTINALHVSVNMQANIFIENYKSIENYANSNQKEKYAYLMKLLDMEEKLNLEKMFAESMACKLFGLYLSTFLENDNSEMAIKARDKFFNFIKTQEL
jgi:hypothetical protein